MTEGPAHPSTIAMLEAWKRMDCAGSEGLMPAGPGAVTGDEDALVGRLFVLQKQAGTAWSFRTAGEQIAATLGRPVPGRDFLDLWTGSDREMVRSLIMAVAAQGAPGLVRAQAESLSGRAVRIEIALAPLPGVANGNTRLLGHYQDLQPETETAREPVWRHALIGIVPPERRAPRPRLRLASRNGERV